MSKDYDAYARVTLTVEIVVGRWGDGCDLAQVHRQAAESALDKIRNKFQEDSTVRLVGKPRVRAIITDNNDARAEAQGGESDG